MKTIIFILKELVWFLIIPVFIALTLWVMSFKIAQTIEKFYKVEHINRYRPIIMNCIEIENKLICEKQNENSSI